MYRFAQPLGLCRGKSTNRSRRTHRSIVWSFDHITGDFACRCRAFFNSTSATISEDDDWCTCCVIDREREEELACDRYFFFDQHSFDWKLSNFHRKHARCVCARLIRRSRECHAADCRSARHPRLNLDHDFAASGEQFICGNCGLF